MAIELIHVSKCWCGSARMTAFADHYLRCTDCGTLINSPRLSDQYFCVGDDERNFYNKDYWFAYQRERHGLPDILERTREDLAGRCLYWLDVVLRYKHPPGRSIEIGCSHGGFVALMKMAGFDAMGVELSPWVAEYAVKTFDISVHSKTLEDLQIEPESIDCIILMDVVEHLPDPKSMMSVVTKLLKPDGIAVIQTPCYRETGADWEMLIDQEHLCLFTEDGLRSLLCSSGLSHVAVHPPLFPHDIFLIAGKSPLTKTSGPLIEMPPLQTPSGRKLLAMLDLYSRLATNEETWKQRLQASERDREARLGIIEAQGEQLGVVEAERNDLQGELCLLREQQAAIEADCAARLAVIEAQGERLGALEGERNDLRGELHALRAQLAVSEADRAARLAVIEAQGERLGALEGEVLKLREQLIGLQQQLASVRVEEQRMLQALLAISQTRAYKLLRYLGRWKWLEQMIRK